MNNEQRTRTKEHTEIMKKLDALLSKLDDRAPQPILSDYPIVPDEQYEFDLELVE